MNDNDNANMYEIFERLNRVQSQPSKIDEAAATKARLDESAFQAAIGKKKYGEEGMKALQKAGRDHASDKTMKNIRNKYDKYDEAQNNPMEESKPDFLDLDKDGNKKEPMKSAAKDAKKMDEVVTLKPGAKERLEKEKQDKADSAKALATKMAGPPTVSLQKTPMAPRNPYKVNLKKEPMGEAAKPDYIDLDKDGDRKESMKKAAQDAKKSKKEVDEGVYQDSPAKSKVPAFQRKAKGGNWKTSMQDLEHDRSQSPTGRAGLEKAKRRLGQVSEGLDQIMRTMGRDIEQFKRSGELTDELYSALYDYYMDEMPYGVAKARTGDPYEWITNKLESELGVDEGNLFTGNLAKARAAGVKKADLDGDGDMEKVNELDINLIKAAQKDAAKTVKHSDPESDRNIHKKYGHRSDRDDTGNDDDYDEFGNEKKKKSQPAAGDKRGRGRPKKYTADKPRQERVTAKSRKADRTAYTKKKVGEEELSEKSVSKAQQRFMGMAHTMQKGEKVPGASKELKKVAKTMGKGDVKDFAKTKHKGLPEKKKKTDEMTTSGGVAPSMAPMGVRQTKEEMTDVLRAEKGGVKGATQPPADSQFAPGDKRNSTPAPSSTSAPKAVKETDKVPTNKPKEKTGSGSMQFGKGIYDSFNRKLEGMIAEGMEINAHMNTDAQGGPSKTLTITATDESAEQLMMLLKMAGLTQDSEACPHCGQSPCGCDHVEEDLANSPDEVTASSEVVTQGMSGGLNKPKSTGQTTVPVMNVDPKRQGMLETMQRQLWKKYQG